MEYRILPVAIVGVVLSACASSSKKSPPGAVPVSSAPAASKPDIQYDARIAAANKRAKEMGYHVESRRGEQFYCRTVAPTGSRLTENECLTVDTLIQSARMSEQNQAAQRQSQSCQGAGCMAH